MTTIYICRHGETEWNQKGYYQGIDDSSLTEKGMLQARKIGLFLVDKNITRIFCSPMLRAQTTASVINQFLDVEIEVIPTFHETNFGDFQKKRKEEVLKMYPDFFEKRKTEKLSLNFPNGESYFEVYQRIRPAVEEILSLYDNFLIVGHGSMNRMLRCVIMQKDLEKACKDSQGNNEVVECRVGLGEEVQYEL